jgi:hypothetical protein
VGLFGVGHDHRDGMKFAALSLVIVLLARERFILVGAALGFCAVQSLFSFFIKRDWLGLFVAIVTGTLFLVVIRSLKNYKPSYQWPKSRSIVELLVGLVSLGFAILVFQLIPR